MTGHPFPLSSYTSIAHAPWFICAAAPAAGFAAFHRRQGFPRPEGCLGRGCAAKRFPGVVWWLSRRWLFHPLLCGACCAHDLPVSAQVLCDEDAWQVRWEAKLHTIVLVLEVVVHLLTTQVWNNGFETWRPTITGGGRADGLVELDDVHGWVVMRFPSS